MYRRTFLRAALGIAGTYVPKDTPSVSYPLPSPTSTYEGTLTFRATEAAALKAEKEQSKAGMFSLPSMDYPIENGIPPVWSAQQIEYLRRVHHQHQVDTLNALTIGSQYEGQLLHVVINKTSFDATTAAIHGAACDHFNLSFLYKSMKPWGSDVPAQFANYLQLQYGSGSTPTECCEKAMYNHFMSFQKEGFGWLVYEPQATRFAIVAMETGTSPITNDLVPLVAIDLHPHAYLFDYGQMPDGLDKYLKNAFKAIDWRLAARNYTRVTLVHSS